MYIYPIACVYVYIIYPITRVHVSYNKLVELHFSFLVNQHLLPTNRVSLMLKVVYVSDNWLLVSELLFHTMSSNSEYITLHNIYMCVCM